MAISEDLIAVIKIESKDAKASLNKLTNEVKKFDKSLESSQKEIKQFEGMLGKLAVGFTGFNQALELSAKAINGVGIALGGTLGQFSEFEKALVGVAKTSNLTKSQAAELGDDIQELSKKIPVSTNELLGLAEAAGQLGVTGSSNLQNFAETLAKLGRSSDIAGEEAARSLARLLNQTGESVDQIDELASVIVALGNNFAATESEIVRVASELGRSTTVFGLSSAEVAGLSTALKAMGVQAQLGGSAVGRAFREIDNAIRTGGDALDALVELTGKSADQLRKDFAENAVDVFTDFIGGLKEVEESNGSVAASLERLNLKGDEISKTIPVLASGFDQMKKALELANKEVANATALNTEAGNAFDTLSGDTDLAVNALNNLGVEIGQIFAPAARSVLQTVAEIAGSLSSLAEAIQQVDFEELATSIRNFGIALGAVSLGVFVTNLIGAVSAIGGLSAAISAMGGLPVILASMAAALKGLAVAAAAAIIPLLKFAVVAVGVLAVASAVDILIRNLHQLRTLGRVILDSFLLLGNQIEQVFQNGLVAFSRFMNNLVKLGSEFKIAGFKLIDDEQLVRSTKALMSAQEGAERLKLKQIELSEEIKKNADLIDTGIAGNLMNAAEQMIDIAGFTEDYERASKKASDAQRVISETVEMTTDQMKILNQLTVQNQKLTSQINSIGASQTERIRQNLALQLQALNAKRNELRAAGNLLPAIAKQLELQESLTREFAKQQIAFVTEQNILNILDKNKALRLEINDANLDAFEIIAKQGQLELENLKRQLDQKGLSENEIRLLKKQIELQQKLNDKKVFQAAQSQIDEANPVGAEVGSAILEAGKLVGPEIIKSLKKFGFNFDGLDSEIISGFAVGASEFFDNFEGFMRGSANIVKGSLVAGATVFDKMFGTNTQEFMATLGDVFVEAAGFIGSTIDVIAGGIAQLFDPQFIESIADTLTEAIENLPELLTKAFESLDKAIGSLLDNLPELVQSLMDAVINGVSMLIDRLPELIDGLMTALTDFIERLPELTAKIFEALPGIITAFVQRLPDVIDSLFQAIPQIISQLIAAIPDILVSLVEGLPKIIEQLISGIIGAMGEIVGAFVDFIVNGGMEKIVMSLIKLIPRVALALVNGIVSGLRRAISGIFGGVKIPNAIQELPKKIEEGAKNLARNIARETSEVFKVLDLNEATKNLGVDAPVEDLGKGIREGAKKAAGILQKAWKWIKEKILDPLLDGLEKVWRWIDEKILQPIIMALREVWEWIFDNVIEPLLKGLQEVWNFINETFIKPLLSGLRSVWRWVDDNIVGPLVNGLQEVFNWFDDNILKPLASIFAEAFQPISDFFQNVFKGNISEAFEGVWESFKAIPQQIVDGLKDGLTSIGDFFSDIGTKIWESLKSGLSGIGDFLKRAFDNLNPANLFEKIFKVDGKGKGTVEKALNIDIPFANFAQGGMVPGRAVVSGDSVANDRILAMLSPGEAVIPRSIMQEPKLAAIIRAVMEGELDPPKLFGGTLGKIAKGDFKGAAKDVGGGVSSAGKDIISGGGAIFDQVIGGPLKELWKKVSDFVFGDMLWKMFENNKFHNGGLVPGFAAGGEVPATLQSGEFVMNRGAVNSLGTSLLGNMNRTGQTPQANQTFNFDITVKVEASAQNLNETYVRNRLIPTMKDELRRSSLRGEFIMSEKGLRKT